MRILVYKGAMPHAQRIASWLLIALAFAGPASACSITLPIDVFEPGPKPGQRVDLFHLPEIPPIAVDIGRFDRASSLNDCDYDAEVDLILRWTSPTDFRWEDVGLYVRPVGSDSTGQVPERARMVNGVPHLTVYVSDGEPAAALDQEYEIRAVDRWLRLGPVARFSIRSKARPAEAYESLLKGRALTFDYYAVHHLKEQFSWATPALAARFESGELQMDRCGLYSPYGCGSVEMALLTHGDALALTTPLGEVESMPVVCVGIRQSSGRTLRMVLTGDQKWFIHTAAAEWVSDSDAHDWTRVAAGCAALIASVGIRETAYADAQRARMDARRRRPKPCGATQGTGGCK